MKKRDLILAGAAAGMVLAGLPYQKMDIAYHVIHSPKIQHDVRICVLADVHCRRFGTKQSRITERVKKIHPDLILFPGDLFDVDRDYEISFELVEELKDYPRLFTSGNHDMYLTNDIETLRKRLKDMGVHVLEDQEECFTANGQEIELFGMTDHGRKPIIQASDLRYMFHTDDFRILISHRPNYIDFYKAAPCDLIISGHAHGGQWRIPFMHRGVYAPQLGMFSRYTEGMHDLNGKKFFISRGLASGDPHIPRLYNNPEIGVIDLKGEEEYENASETENTGSLQRHR